MRVLASLSWRRHRRFLSSDAAAARELLRAGLRARREAAAFGEESASASIASSDSTSSSTSSTKSQLAAALVAAHARSKRSPGGEQRFVSVLCSDFGVSGEELARAVEAWRRASPSSSSSSSSSAAAAAPASPTSPGPSSSRSAPLPGDDNASAVAAAEERLRRASTPAYEAFWPAVAGVPGGLATLAELRAAALSPPLPPPREEGAGGGAGQGAGGRGGAAGGRERRPSRSPSSPALPRRRAALAASLARSLAPALASGTSLVLVGAAAAGAAAAAPGDAGAAPRNAGAAPGDAGAARALAPLSRAASEAQAALHAVTSARDWEARLAPPRAVFALLHERGFGRGTPLATVACFSGGEVATRASEALPPVAGGGGGAQGDGEAPRAAPGERGERGGDAAEGGPSATLYALCSAHAGLRGLDVGRAAARGAAEALAHGGGGSGLPAATRVATLSPLPGFLPWLRAAEGRASGSGGSSSGSSSARKLEFRREETEAIREAAAAKGGGRRSESRGALPLLLSTLDGHGSPAAPSFPPDLLRSVLLRLAARFLALKTVRRLPSDPVARFHCANGAALARICWRADDGGGGPSSSSSLASSASSASSIYQPQRARRIAEESAGIMVNYSYLWPGGEEPLALAGGAGRLRVGEGVARLLAGEDPGGRWGLVD